MSMSIKRSSTMVLCALFLLPACRVSRTVDHGLHGVGVVASVRPDLGEHVNTDGTAVQAIKGAMVGGTSGAFIGHQMDEQAEELRAELNLPRVTRVGEGIRLTFESSQLFDVGQSMLSGSAQLRLNALARSLGKYPKTEILVEGHTDTDGARDDNQSLTNRRVLVVKAYLVSQGVDADRIITAGYGGRQPIAENTNAIGKASNRRMEIAIYANKRMKKAAGRGRK